MSGTRAGGLKAKETNIKKYGNNFYNRIGSKGGKVGHTGGFFGKPALAKIAGAKGGRKSRRDGTYTYTAVSEECSYSGSVSHLAKVLGVTEPSIYVAYRENRKLLGKYEITRRKLERTHGRAC